ncbi:STX12 protein, partial [Polypterus senegalus]
MSYRTGDSYGSQPRDFNTLIQICSSNIQKITQNTAQIKNMVNQLGTKQDSSDLQERLQQMQHSTNQLAKETNRHLKELGSLPVPHSPSEQRQQKIQKERLMNNFSGALNTLQAVQRRAAEKEKESVARARAGSRLSSDILDVNQIFKDLAVMIHDQGEMIDSIEANVESAEVHVERGTEQLQQAAYYQVCVSHSNAT